MARAIDHLLQCSTVHPTILAPTHNNARMLPEMLQRFSATGLPVLVVDDGCTDDSNRILAEWAGASSDHRLITHEKNVGKAAALHSGFIEAARAGFTHAISIDTDGQLQPEDIPELLKQAISDPTALIVGFRDAKASGYPLRSRLGRWFSNQMVHLETGHQVRDSQCGLRIYPLSLVNSVRCMFGRFGFETEIITRAIWAGTPVLQAPVICRYFPPAMRISHFRPILDSTRAIGMHVRLLIRAVWPFGRRNAPPGAMPPRSIVREFLHWLNPVTAWRHVRHTKGARERFSLGFAIGIFIANLPIYGLQSVSALFIARRFKMNPVSVLAGANVGVPPLNAIMIACGIAVGHLVLHGAWPRWTAYHFSRAALHQLLVPMLVEWIIGSIIVGAVMAVVSFLGLDLLLRLISDPKTDPEVPE